MKFEQMANEEKEKDQVIANLLEEQKKY